MKRALSVFYIIMLICLFTPRFVYSQGLKLVAPDCYNLDMYGHSVAISGDYAIIGAPDD
jgi:hypothetical protein